MPFHSLLSLSLLLKLPSNPSQYWGPSLLTFRTRNRHLATQPAQSDVHDGIAVLEYDLCIVGAGASGMFASGASTMLGSKTLLIDRDLALAEGSISNIGGDCTVSSCVPSKAVRSIATMATTRGSAQVGFKAAKQHAENTVRAVRDREDPNYMVARNKNLDIVLVRESECRFTDPHQMEMNVTRYFGSKYEEEMASDSLKAPRKLRVRSKSFLIATGASPVVPQSLKVDAEAAALPLYTYRSVYGPLASGSPPNTIWDVLSSGKNETESKHVVIAGGGATACEIAQAIGRLGGNGNSVRITMIAPMMLPKEDPMLQQAAAELLIENGVDIILNNRVVGVASNKRVKLSGGTMTSLVDALVVCVGRNPDLESLNLECANIKWKSDIGVIVNPNTLRSVSAKHVFACGDCASAVNQNPQSRTATHGAWTGYQAASNTRIPRIWRLGHSATHQTVPRVVYTDPQLASVGLSQLQCIEKYGMDGFDSLHVYETGTDRADMEHLERLTIGFVEIRSEKISGRIIGYTGCGPTASDVANEMAVAITNKLSVRDIARSLHSYPSHGYLMYRVALALTFSNIWGLVEVCGPVGGAISTLGRFGSKIIFHAPRKLWKRRALFRQKSWELIGSFSRAVLVKSGCTDNRLRLPVRGTFRIVSYIDIYKNVTFYDTNRTQLLPPDYVLPDDAAAMFKKWMDSKPKR